MVYSRILDINSALVVDSLHEGNLFLEPGKLIELLPAELTNISTPLCVLVSDGVESVEYTLTTFISRSYRVIGKKIRFGSKKLMIDRLSVSVGVKFLIEDLTGITEDKLD